MKAVKFEIVYKKEKEDEWNIVVIWGYRWSEIRDKFREKIGKSLEQIDNYAILNP